MLLFRQRGQRRRRRLGHELAIVVFDSRVQRGGSVAAQERGRRRRLRVQHHGRDISQLARFGEHLETDRGQLGASHLDVDEDLLGHLQITFSSAR